MYIRDDLKISTNGPKKKGMYVCMCMFVEERLLISGMRYSDVRSYYGGRIDIWETSKDWL